MMTSTHQPSPRGAYAAHVEPTSLLRTIERLQAIGMRGGELSALLRSEGLYPGEPATIRYVPRSRSKETRLASLIVAEGKA